MACSPSWPSSPSRCCRSCSSLPLSRSSFSEVVEMSGLRLVHDVLDVQLLDRHEEKIGRVDAVTLELRDGRPPRVAEILTGALAPAGRVRRRVGVRFPPAAALLHIRHPGNDSAFLR